MIDSTSYISFIEMAKKYLKITASTCICVLKFGMVHPDLEFRTGISVKYRISAVIKYRISDIGYRISDIGWGDRTDISDIGYQLKQEYRISARNNQYAIPK